MLNDSGQIDYESIKHKLGKIPDTEIAKELNCSISAIWRYRSSLGIEPFQEKKEIDWNQWDIPPFQKPQTIDWTEWDSYLGKVSDAKLSRMINCKASSVAKRRKKLKIPAFKVPRRVGRHEKIEYEPLNPSNKRGPDVKQKNMEPDVKQKNMAAGENKIDWEKWDNQLGKKPDRILAQEIGCSGETVAIRRKQMNIPPYRRYEVIDWEKWNIYLRKISDLNLARKIGCNPLTVAKRRNELHISSFGSFGNRIDWTKWDSQLGKKSDAVLAQEIGCVWKTVYLRRRNLNIPPFKKREKSQLGE